jgi:hypothetical protein
MDMYNRGVCPSSCELGASTRLGFEGVDLSTLRVEDFPVVSESMSVCVFRCAPVPRTTYRGWIILSELVTRIRI